MVFPFRHRTSALMGEFEIEHSKPQQGYVPGPQNEETVWSPNSPPLLMFCDATEQARIPKRNKNWAGVHYLNSAHHLESCYSSHSFTCAPKMLAIH